MTRQELFCQCMMTNGNRMTVGFIPSRAAVIGNVIALVREQGLDRGWRVESVGKPIAKDEMRMFERQHKSQRKASDIGKKSKRGRIGRK